MVRAGMRAFMFTSLAKDQIMGIYIKTNTVIIAALNRSVKLVIQQDLNRVNIGDSSILTDTLTGLWCVYINNIHYVWVRRVGDKGLDSSVWSSDLQPDMYNSYLLKEAYMIYRRASRRRNAFDDRDFRDCRQARGINLGRVSHKKRRRLTAWVLGDHINILSATT